jgi:non-lysosomal glucosylceramidase
MEGGFVRGGANYVYPAAPTQPFALSFSLGQGENLRPLDANGFAHVTFDGRYPIGRVAYRDDACPLLVDLEAFSPFIPLSVDDSSLPAIVLRYRVTNPTPNKLAGRVVGQLANPVCLDSGATLVGERVNRVIREAKFTAVELTAQAGSAPQTPPSPDVSFDDFERHAYGEWTAEGAAFGAGPVAVADVSDYQGDVAAAGQRLVNSHASAAGDDADDRDAKTGRLVSGPFTIVRRYISLLVGGGNHPGQTCVNLIVDGKTVASLTGAENNTMQRRALATAAWEGEQARLEIVDQVSGAW